MTEALSAEWTKLRTLSSTGWLLLGTVALTVAVSVAVAAATHISTNDHNHDPTKLSLSGIYLGQAVIAVLAVLTISDEYSTGMIRASLSALPRRPVLLAAKAMTVAGLALVAGLFATAGCLIVGHLMIQVHAISSARGYTSESLSHGATLRALAGTVVYLVLIALLSLGIAAAIRYTAVSIGAVLGLLYLPPILAQAVTDPLRRHLQQIAPTTAGLAIQTTTNLRSLPLSPWEGIGVLATWALTSLLIGGLLLQQRDA